MSVVARRGLKRRGEHVNGETVTVLVCVSKPPSLVLNVTRSFSSSRTEGAVLRRGGGVKRGNVKMEASRGEAKRRTRKTKIDIRDGSDEEQDEEFKSNYLLLLFVFQAFISCPTAHKMVLIPLPHKSYSWFLFFLPFFLLLLFCFSAIISV